MTVDDVTRARFDAAFPWFDHGRWGWDYDPDYAGDSPFYRIRDAGPGAKGSIETYMSGATEEQWKAVRAWLRREFNPAAEVPASQFALKFAMRPADEPDDRPVGSHPLGNIIRPKG